MKHDMMNIFWMILGFGLNIVLSMICGICVFLSVVLCNAERFDIAASLGIITFVTFLILSFIREIKEIKEES